MMRIMTGLLCATSCASSSSMRSCAVLRRSVPARLAMLNGDQEAKKMFVGDDCGLCNKKDDFEFGAHNLP